MTSTIESIDKKIAKLHTKLAELNTAKDVLLSETTIECAACKQVFMIKDAVFVQTHSYVFPYSCTGGDYWIEGEDQCDCPKCGERLRLYRWVDAHKLKRLFKEVKNEHKR